MLALVIGAVLIAFSDDDVIESLPYFFSYPWDFFTRSADAIWSSYSALRQRLGRVRHAISTTLERAAPLICAGLGVTLAFRAGLFNIGAQGQLLVGALAAGYVGFTWDLPAGLHLVVACRRPDPRWRVWGGIVGLLKARTGAHEVITTIMFNYLAGLGAALRAEQGGLPAPRQRQPALAAGRRLRDVPEIFDVHSASCWRSWPRFVWWVLERSTLGFELRAVGANAEPRAPRA